MDFLAQHIEALIFCAPKPITEFDIQDCLKEMFDAQVPMEDVHQGINNIAQRYKSEQHSFELVESGGGYQFLTKPAYESSIGILLKRQSKKRLSNSALETLAIIAYKQPVTRTEMENIRGVNCDYSLTRLLEKELISVKGKAETVGRPLLYVTSPKFMDYFGINDLKELPTPKDFSMDENTIGENQEE